MRKCKYCGGEVIINELFSGSPNDYEMDAEGIVEIGWVCKKCNCKWGREIKRRRISNINNKRRWR